MAQPGLHIGFTGKTAIFEVISEEKIGVRVIFGGNDGILVTIDPNGKVVVHPPDGPGDPELRKAVSAILQGVKVLNRIGTAERGAAA